MIMKKLFVMAAAVGVALTGCTSDKADVGYIGDAQQKIEFANPVVAPNTRAAVPGEIGTNYSVNEHFGVFAVWTLEDYATWGAGKLYMDNVEVEHKTVSAEYTAKTFAPVGNPYYWPKNGKLTFAAYSPYDAKNHGSVTYDGAGLEIANFAVRANGVTKAESAAATAVDDKQYDLLYAPRVYNATKASAGTGTPYAGLDIKFKHALSSIMFTVRTEAAYAGTTITIKKIQVNQVKSQGTFNETITDGVAATGIPAWSAQATPADYVVYKNDASEEGEVVVYNGGVGKSIYSDYKDGKNLILIPQSFEGVSEVNPLSDASITVVWTMKSATGDVIEQTNHFDLGDYTFDSVGAQWQMGRRYTYNLVIGLDKIYFNPTVENWTDAVGGDITIK